MTAVYRGEASNTPNHLLEIHGQCGEDPNVASSCFEPDACES